MPLHFRSHVALCYVRLKVSVLGHRASSQKNPSRTQACISISVCTSQISPSGDGFCGFIMRQGIGAPCLLCSRGLSRGHRLILFPFPSALSASPDQKTSYRCRWTTTQPHSLQCFSAYSNLSLIGNSIISEVTVLCCLISQCILLGFEKAGDRSNMRSGMTCIMWEHDSATC